jgi:pimeloyl-ACP methyl ester carboxylesterase
MTPATDFDPAEFRAFAEAKRQFFAFFAKKRPAPRPEDVAFMATGAPIAVDHADHHLEVRAWGDGPSVLLAHGIMSSGGAFRSLVPALVARGLRAVAFDAPAHGASGGAFAYADEVADALLSIHATIGALAGVVGHSMGGAWALQASRAGLRMPRFVCMSLPVDTSLALNFYIQHNALPPPVATQLRRLIAAFAPSPVEPRALVGRLAAAALVIHDRDDSLAPFADAEQLAHHWPRATTLWTARLGHFHILHNPRVVTAVADFIAGAPRRDEEFPCR